VKAHSIAVAAAAAVAGWLRDHEYFFAVCGSMEASGIDRVNRRGS